MFHGGPLDGQTREHIPWPRFSVLVSDPMPDGHPHAEVPFAIAYYEPAEPRDLHQDRLDYYYRGEE